MHSSYWLLLFPAELITAFGMGMVFVPVNNTALVGVAPSDAGVASALINSTQQVGGSVGTALLNTIATSATVSYLAGHGIAGGAGGGPSGGTTAATVSAATVHGFSVAFAVAGGILGLALIVVATFINAPAGSGNPEPAAEDARTASRRPWPRRSCEEASPAGGLVGLWARRPAGAPVADVSTSRRLPILVSNTAIAGKR